MDDHSHARHQHILCMCVEWNGMEWNEYLPILNHDELGS
jgi:hypothetical protein